MSRSLRRGWQRALGMFRRRADADLAEEFASHIQLLVDDNIRRGMSPAEAHRQARIRFGNMKNMQERYHDQGGLPFLEVAYQDMRFALRSFLRSPRFTIPALVALTLGIGATSAIFSVVRGVVLEPLPYQDPERVVAVWEHRVDRNRPRNVIAPANYVAWRERQKSFEFLGMVQPATQTFMFDNQPHEIAGYRASADALFAFGTQPRLGRLFTADEDLPGTDNVIILSHEFWQSRLGGRADVFGSLLTVNGVQRGVVGVMAPRFTIEGQVTNYLIPYGLAVEAMRNAPGRGGSHGIARLKHGVTFEQAFDDMKTLMSQLATEAPQRNTNWSITLVPIHDQTVDQITPALSVLSGAVLLVLLVACVNVANLLLARSTVRQRELGLRTALGAGRGRLVRQMLTESTLLSLAGGVLGLMLAWVLHLGLLALIGDRIPVPRLDQVALDSTVIGFTLALSLLTGIVFGVIPALFATGNANETLREGGRHSSGPRARRVLGALVVAEVALSLVLLAGAGLLIRSFMALQSVPTGMQVDNLLTARVSVSGSRYADPKVGVAMFDAVLERIRSIPGVEQAAAVSFLPMTGLGIGTSFHRADRPTPPPGEQLSTAVKPITPNFFKTMGIPLVRGRDFSAADTWTSTPVAIVSESLVKQAYPNEDPIGQRLQVSIGGVARPDGAEIVGVVSDIRMATLNEPPPNATYMPHTQLPIGVMTFVVRSGVDPSSLVPGMAAAVRASDPALPLADVRTMDEVVAATLARPRAVSSLLTVFAVIALILAGVGVYGVMAYSVSQRTQEIGVRIALGASSAAVFRMMIVDAFRLVAIGMVVGVVAAAWLSRFLTTMLFEIGRFDVVTFVATALVLGAVATLASYVPARRGMRIAPVEALRAE